MSYSNLFADGLNNSSIDAAWTQAYGTWTEDNNYIVTAADANQHLLLLSAAYDLDEGRILCDIYLAAEASSSSRSGFYFNYKSGETANVICVFINAANDKIYITESTRFTERANADVTINTGSWYQLGVTWNNTDSIVHAWVDGVEKCSYDFGNNYFDEDKQVALYKKAAGGTSTTRFRTFDLDNYVADAASNNYVYIL